MRLFKILCFLSIPHLTLKSAICTSLVLQMFLVRPSSPEILPSRLLSHLKDLPLFSIDFFILVIGHRWFSSLVPSNNQANKLISFLMIVEIHDLSRGRKCIGFCELRQWLLVDYYRKNVISEEC